MLNLSPGIPGNTLRSALSEILKKSGLKATVVGEPVLFDVVFAERDESSGIKVLQPAFYAIERRYIPLLVSIVAVVVTNATGDALMGHAA